MRLEFSGTHRGFEYKVIVMDMGHRCGYVCLPENHPWYNKNYCDIDVRIHGGLTFSEMCNGHPILSNGYWIGFDCLHAFDLPDLDEVPKELLKMTYRFSTLMGKITGVFGGDKYKPKVRNLYYVKKECKNLCAECADVMSFQKSYEASVKGK